MVLVFPLLLHARCFAALHGTSIAPATAHAAALAAPGVVLVDASILVQAWLVSRSSAPLHLRADAVVGLVAVVAVGHFLAMALADGTRDDAAAGAPRSLWALYTRVRAAKRAAPYASTAAGMSVAFSSSSAAAAAAAAPPASRVARLTALLRLFAVATLAAQFYAVASGDSPPTASLISIAQWIDLRSVVTLRLALLCAGVAVASRLGAQYDTFAMLQIAGDGAAGGRAAHRWWLLPRWGLGAYEAPAVMGWQLAVGVVLALAPPTTPLVDDGGDGPDVAASASRATLPSCSASATSPAPTCSAPIRAVPTAAMTARAPRCTSLSPTPSAAPPQRPLRPPRPAAAAATPAAERAELSQVLRGGADLGAAAALTSPSFSPSAPPSCRPARTRPPSWPRSTRSSRAKARRK